MSVKLYRLYCEICNWKRITDGSDIQDLMELKTSPIPRGIPKVDLETKKVVQPKSKDQIKKFRCPKCGRVVIPKKISDPQRELEEKQELEARKKARENEDRLDADKRRSSGQSI